MKFLIQKIRKFRKRFTNEIKKTKKTHNSIVAKN